MSLRNKTRAYIERRATQSNVDLSILVLDCTPEDEETPTNCVEVSIIYDGALDENFYMDDLYAVNVADWIGELLLGESNRAADGTEWQVLVTQYAYEDAGSVVYSLTEIGAASGGEAGPEWYESREIPPAG